MRAQSEIRLLTEGDVEAALTLQRPEGWNQTERDWSRLLQLEPAGCFAAEVNGRVIGTVTTTTYGAALAWIGMMLVAPEHRGRGIGRQLFSAALDHLRASGTSAVKLDATPAGRSLYEVFGFVRESVIERWETVAHHTLVNCESNDACEIRKKIHALDQSVFGADRTRLLDTLITDSIVTPQAITTAGGKLQGYALARCGLAASYVGPIIAQDESTALELLDRMIGQLRGQKVYLDFHPGCGATTEALLKRGFLKQRELVRMRYCRAVTAPTSPLVFAIAGPETG
jgi:predicted N-acetyltransferase YhbS